jgi:hypothetical protein
MIAYIDRYEFCKQKYQDFAMRQLAFVFGAYVKGLKNIPYRGWDKEHKKASSKMIKYLIRERKMKQAIKAIMLRINHYFKAKNN